MEAVRPKGRRKPVNVSQLLLQFSSAVPTIGNLVPTTLSIPTEVNITPVDPKIIEATKDRSDVVEEDKENRDSPYAGEPDSFPDII